MTDNCVTTGTLNVHYGETVIINGNGFAIDGNNTHQVLNVVEHGILTLNNVTIRNGNAFVGGGIYNQGGTATLTNSRVFGNNGGGIYII